MTDILFYHLERARLGGVLPGLLVKTLERDWRALVVCGSSEQVEVVDAHLWTYHQDSFLPHASQSSSVAPSKELILLCALENGSEAGQSLEDSNPIVSCENNANILFLIAGASITPEFMTAYERCVLIFDGNDDAALNEARALWKAIKDKGDESLLPTYWRQNYDGRWEKQA